jgi:hypothetical protein
MSSELADSLTSEILKKLIRSSLSEKFEEFLFLFRGAEKSQKQKLEAVTKWYRDQRLVMVLGAGSSVSYGLPNWDTLLQKLLLITIKSDDENKKMEKRQAYWQELLIAYSSQTL